MAKEGSRICKARFVLNESHPILYVSYGIHNLNKHCKTSEFTLQSYLQPAKAGVKGPQLR